MTGIKATHAVYDVLNDLGVPQNLLGYEYIAYGLQYMIDLGDRRPSMTKDVYPIIAERYDTTSSRVERAIRHSIEKTFDNPNLDSFDKYFGNSLDPYSGKVTNSQFLYSLKGYIVRNS